MSFSVFEVLAEFRVEDGIVMPVDGVYSVYVNGSYVSSLVMSPCYVSEAVIGFLVGSGVVGSLSDIIGVSIGDGNVDVSCKGPVRPVRLYVDDCVGFIESGGFVKSRVRVDRGLVEGVVSDFMSRLDRFHGVQATGLYDLSSNNAVIAFDVSRFMSIAKALGYALTRGFSLDKSIAVASGRVSGDLVSMIARLGIPILVGFKSILYSGFKYSILLGVTLILYRGGELRILSYPERIST
ncbi:MAG: formate dehydrogenase accessory sulfurtransferase FdhD [Acidilobaceae archaeon]